jgi:hypothetical protein
MKLLGFLAVASIAGCAEGASPFGRVEPFDRSPPHGPGDPGPDDVDTLVWSVEADAGTTHRLIALGEDAVLLAASRQQVTVSRFGSDGQRAWSTELPQIAGGGPVELGGSREGRIVVVGSPSDGGHELAIVSLAGSGDARWTAELVGDWGRVEARGVAVHDNCAIAVLAEESMDGRPTRTVIEFLDDAGHRLARESFSHPLEAFTVVADGFGFAALGRSGSRSTWVRGYRTDGMLDGANLLAIDTTGVFTRAIDGGEEAWVSGMVDPVTACLMPAIMTAASWEIEETSADDPIAVLPGGDVIAIDDGIVRMIAPGGATRSFTPELGDAHLVAAGPYDTDSAFVLSHDLSTANTHLHRVQ